MLQRILSRVVGDPNEREMQRLQTVVNEINALEQDLAPLKDETLRDKTTELRERLHTGETLDGLLPQAFAVVREASKRTIAMRHFDVQLLGGIVLHQGKVAEMKTGEGKTLVATLSLYLNALVGRGAHLVTVNDYLARRDTQWMGPVYQYLGLTVGLLQQGGEAFIFDPGYTRGKFRHLRSVKRREAYQADITFGTNNEFGFDYLRDNLAYDLDRRVQRELSYAIVDEADNILIDEARTPLIISGPLSRAEQEEEEEYFTRFARIAAKLELDVHYELDERTRNVFLTDAGLARIEQEVGIDDIYAEISAKYISYMEQALKAEVLYQLDRDYIKQRGQIILVDEFTGRLMPDRRLSEGLHQAIEAKEKVRIQPRMMTQATITIQNYFRMYRKLAGMTGTAATEAEEFQKTYGLDVIALPTNVEYMARLPDTDLVEVHRREDGVAVTVYHARGHPNDIRYYKRVDYSDLVYGTERAKWKAIVEDIEQCYWARRPVLVGTTSVEASEQLSERLEEREIPHKVLNAKNHTQEAAIIAQAGEPQAITIATNMAGRGVDIKLGGELSDETIREAHRRLRKGGFDPFRVSQEQLYSAIAEVEPNYVARRDEVLKLKGLYVIGTERHEARRIDNQLRGRAGRQGEPGSSRFYVSLEDDLMRRFGGERVKSVMEWTGMGEDVPIEHNLITKSIERVQTGIEGYNFDIRKHLLEYDDVLNRQRELIYEQRYRVLTKDTLEEGLCKMIRAEVDDQLNNILGKPGDEWKLLRRLDGIVGNLPAPKGTELPSLGGQAIFPPFIVTLLAQAMSDRSSNELLHDLVEATRTAVDAYREHVLEEVIGENWKKAREDYDQDLEEKSEKLEQIIDNYVDLLKEQGRALHNRNLLEHLHRVFPLPLGVKAAELNGWEIGEVKDHLLATLKRVYHQQVCKKLIDRVQEETPSGIDLKNVYLGGLEKDEDPERAFLPALLARAQANGREDELERLAADIKAGRGRWRRGNLVDFLLELNQIVVLNLEDLEAALREVVASEYDKWADGQVESIERELNERVQCIDTPTEEEVTQLLLHVYYAGAKFSKERQRWERFPAQRQLLEFLASTRIADMTRESLREFILTQFEKALITRERVWGQSEMAGLVHLRPIDLEDRIYEDMAKHFGGIRIQGQVERRIADLDDDLYDDVQRAIQAQQMEQRRLSDLDMVDDILQHLGRRWLEQVQEQKVANLEEETLQGAESYLRYRGYFEDQDAEGNFLRQRPSDLSKRLYSDIAVHLGRQQLAAIEGEPIGKLEPSLLQSIQDFLKGRRRFTDEEKVQQFFAYQRLSDLGEKVVYNACRDLVDQELEAGRKKKIMDLDQTTRNRIMVYLEREEFFADEVRRQRFIEERLADLDFSTYTNLAETMGRQQLSGQQRVGDLNKELLAGIVRHLYDEGYLVDKAKTQRLSQQRLSDLGPGFSEDLQQLLSQELAVDLEQQEIGELDKETQKEIRAYLDREGYFLDESKFAALRRQSLSDLDGTALLGLERHLGRKLVAAFDHLRFVNLDQEVRESVLQVFDNRGYLTNRGERNRFIEHQSLSDLAPEIYDAVTHRLGRHQLSGLRARTVAELDEDTQKTILGYLQEQGLFTDDFKVELLPYQRLDEFEPDLREGMKAVALRKFEGDLAQKRIGELANELQTRINNYLDETDYFVDQARAQQIGEARTTDLAADIFTAMAQYLGQRLLEPFKDRRFSELDERLQKDIWQHLSKLGHFIDKTTEQHYAQLELGGLPDEMGSQAYASLLQYLVQEKAREIAHERVADLADDIRQQLWVHLAETGYFFDDSKLLALKEQTTAGLEPNDREGLVLYLGRQQLDEMGDHRFDDLSQEDRESIRVHLRGTDHFLDREKLQMFQEQRLADLEEGVKADVLAHLWEQQERRLRDRRITELDDETRRNVMSFLRDQSLLKDQDMDRFRRQRLIDMEPELREDIVHHIGLQHLDNVMDKRVLELDKETQETFRAFLGRRVMHQVTRDAMLSVMTRFWIDYLTAIENLRQGIGLEAFGQRDPLVEYKIRSFKLFEELQNSIRSSVVATVFHSLPRPLKLAKSGGKQ